MEDEEAPSSLEALKKRHREEQKSLQAEIQAMKKTLNKNDKKRKKEVSDQIQTMEAALSRRQRQELLDLDQLEAERAAAAAAAASTPVDEAETRFNGDDEDQSVETVVDLGDPRGYGGVGGGGGMITSESELSGFPLDSTAGDLILSDPATPSASFTAPSLSTPTSASDSTLTPVSHDVDLGTSSEFGGGKKSKAQKRREQKEKKEREREQRILEEEETNKKGARHIEAEKLKRLLARKNQAIYEVPANGHCLYSAVADQLRRRKEKCESIDDLRIRAASHMRLHKDEFMPFLSNPETGDPLTEDAFEDYCQRVAKSTTWGGQLEIRALANEFKTPIEIIQADGPVINVGGQEYGSESPLILSYHRHFYRLGEHYNSVIDKVGDSEAEEESIGSLSI